MPVAFLFPFLGRICSITMLNIDFVKLRTEHHCPASLLEPLDVVLVDVVADINLGKSVFLGDFIVGIIVGIQLLLLFLNRVYMGTGIIYLMVAVDSGDIVPHGKGYNCITAHTVFVHNLLRSIVTRWIDFLDKVCKIFVYKTAVVEHQIALLNLWNVIQLASAVEGFLLDLVLLQYFIRGVIECSLLPPVITFLVIRSVVEHLFNVRLADDGTPTKL